MDLTPPNQVIRPRYTPTPKMSERKRALFACRSTERPETIDENSDLGPMSPLQFSSSPTSYEAIDQPLRDDTHNTGNNIKTRSSVRRDFKNIIGGKSLLNSIEKPAVRSPHKSASITPTQSPLKTNVLDLDKENCLEMMMKTPSESTEFPRSSFRKSLIFDTGITPESNDGSHLSPNTRKCLQKRNLTNATDSPISMHHLLSKKLASTEKPKAKTSLSFAAEPVISAKTFYGSSFNEPLPPTRTERIKYAVAPKKPSRTRTASAKRTKKPLRSCALQRPVLGSINKGVRRKIVKSTVQATNKIKSMTKMQIMEAAIDLVENYSKKQDAKTKFDGVASSPNQSGASADKNTQITREQIERLQKILKKQRNPFELSSRPLNWTGSKRTENSIPPSNENTLNESMFSDNANTTAEISIEEQRPVDEPIPEESTKRKFFKSKTSANASTYRVTKDLCATVKRGSTLKLMSPKRKKHRKAKVVDDYDEYLAIEQEVNDIIGMLNDTQEDEHIAASTADTSLTSMNSSFCSNIDIDANIQFRERLPYKTNDPQIRKRQETLLNMLISNGICTEENFTIFIAEPDAHKDEAAHILDQLFVIETDGATEATTKDTTIDDDMPMSPASQISSMTLGLALGSPTRQDVPQNNATAGPSDSENYKLYPIFCGKAQIDQHKTNITSGQLHRNDERPSTLQKWKSNGSKQYQIDAGQKAFGGQNCKSCGMFYSVHEPEEEILHQKFHSSRNKLVFKGWQDEQLVMQVPEWGRSGRIIFETEASATNMRLNRVNEILQAVHEDLGYPDTAIKSDDMIYLAIAKQQVVGVCVAEPLQQAYPLLTENGVDYMVTGAPVDVKCGISRIWVIPSYRRCGIATKLVDAVRSHFIRGDYTLGTHELAFSSPTDMGRSFASRVNEAIYVYDNLSVQ